MKPRSLCRLVIALLLWDLILSAALAAQSRPVADEFQEKLSQISAAKPTAPETLSFPSQNARFVRIAIHATSGGSQPCIDELEIFGPDGKENLGLSSRGGVATASSLLPGYPIHQVKHLNDGLYGNSHSWIAATGGEQWAQIELAKESAVASVTITRDREGKFTDRIAEAFEVLVSQDGQKWQTAAKRERTGPNRPRRLPVFPVARLPQKTYDGLVQYAFLRERATWSSVPADDHLSPLVIERPVRPGGAPYWGRIARLAPLERVLVLYEEMIERLAAQGLDLTAERAEAAALRRRAAQEPQSEALYLDARQAKRRLFFRDPALVALEQVLFNKRHPFLESHNYSEHLDGILEPGGGIYILSVPRDEQGRFRPELARVRDLFDGREGIAREPVADYDARTVYFAYRPDKPEVDGWASYWHLYSVRADGSGLRRLTEGPFHDFDAVCLPDGGLAFHSTRCKARFLCWRPQAYVLHRMNADGSDIRRLSHANLSEWKPSVMHDGRILWTRSEYLDKGADFGHTLWAIRPDGTHPELVFGNNTPNCYSQAHEVPGTQELVCTLMSHGDHSGPVALVDRDRGPFDVEAITNITPDTRPQYQMARSHHNTFRDPYPISRDHFLVAHNPDDQHNWALYVIDRYGNRELLYADPEVSSYQPTPLRPRPRPPVLPSSLDAALAENNQGQFTVQDVYRGLGPNVARGRAKYLQVSQEIPADLESTPSGECRADHPPFTDFYASPVHLVHGPAPAFDTRTPNAPSALLRTGYDWTRQVSVAAPGRYRVREGGGWPSYVAKTVVGTVPVAEDGSVSFTAPAGKVLYFQLLDGQYNELQRMRSVVQLQPGERRTCVGCHDDRHASPPSNAALAHAQPRPLQPPPWGAVAFDYQKVVQPALDSHCVRCHDGSAKRCDLRGTLDADRVPASYRTLIAGGWVHYFDLTYGMRHFKAEPLSFGTVQSRLWTVLADKNHAEVKLDEPSMRAIKAWTDLNCPLWPNYIYRPLRPGPDAAASSTRGN